MGLGIQFGKQAGKVNVTDGMIATIAFVLEKKLLCLFAG